MAKGRPLKHKPKGTQIGVIIGGNTKTRLMKAMEKSRRTMSQQVEHMIWKAADFEALPYDVWSAKYRED